MHTYFFLINSFKIDILIKLLKGENDFIQRFNHPINTGTFLIPSLHFAWDHHLNRFKSSVYYWRAFVLHLLCTVHFHFSRLILKDVKNSRLTSYLGPPSFPGILFFVPSSCVEHCTFPYFSVLFAIFVQFV